MRHSDSERDPVERLAEEFAARCRAGEETSAEEYAERYPELASEIRDLFPAIAMMERLSHREQAERRFDRKTGSFAASRSTTLGDFELIREIGRGGMGVVFEALQKSLKRKVALKVLGPNVSGSPIHLQRFRREAEAAARLHHTNIVPVFGVGEHEGLHFYAMQLIAGAPLSEVIRGMRGSPDETVFDYDGSIATEFHSFAPPIADSIAAVPLLQASLLPSVDVAAPAVAADAVAVASWRRDDWKRIAQAMAPAADAVDYAHRHGVLHRDIKPSNLLLDHDGVIWVADFGLAKHEDQTAGSSSGHLIGTLRYMAPEQFGGTTDARGDIYGLGLTLFELLALRPAYEETRHGPLVLRKTSTPVPPLRSIVPGIPRDLETIVLKACAIDPHDRYVNAGAMAEDLRRFAEDRPILARRATPLERLERWARRNPAIAGLLTITMFLLATIAVISSLSNRRDKLALEQVRQESERATLAARQAQRESRRAESNLRLAVRAFDDIMNDLSNRGVPQSLDLDIDSEEPWAVQPAATPADAELLRRLLTFFEEFAKQNRTDELNDEFAKAHQRIGDLYQRLGELDAAEAAYQEALKDLEALARQDDSAALEIRILQARTYNSLGIVTSRRGNAWGAISLHEQAQALLENSAEAMTSEPGRFELAQTLISLGSVSIRSGTRMREAGERGPRRMGPGPEPGFGPGPEPPRWGRGSGPFPDAKPMPMMKPSRRRSPDSFGPRKPPNRTPEHLSGIFERARSLLNALIDANPDRPDYRLSLARCYRNGFLCARRPDDPDAADQMVRNGIQILEKLTSDIPDSPIYQYELADMLCMTPDETRPTPRDPQFEGRLQRAVAICKRLTSVHPHVPEYQALKAGALSKLGFLLHEAGKRPEAEASFRQAVGAMQSLPERFRALPQYAMTQARSYRGFALERTASNHRGEAEKLLERGISALERSIAIYGQSPPVWDYVQLLKRQKLELGRGS